MFRITARGPVAYLETAVVAGLGFVTHAFCTRRTGVSSGGYASLNAGELVGDRPENVAENLARIKKAFAIPENGLVLARQVHRDRIVEIDKDELLPVLMPECDGLITTRPGVALGIKTADCAPILFVDRRLRVTGAVHAGWRGTAQGIAARMMEIFTDRFSSRREDITAIIGPAIGPCCYEVDAPVREAFMSRKGTEDFFHASKKRDRWLFDLAAANRRQLIDAGIPGENILVSGLCTACRRELFFSHRACRGSDEGRQLSFIMIKPGAETIKNA